APSATFNAPASVNEGSPIGLSLTGASDPSSADLAAGFTYAFDCGDGSGYGSFTSTNTASCPTNDNGSRTVKGSVKDKDGGFTEYTTDVEVLNATPVVTAPSNQGSDEGEAHSFSLGSFSDAGVNDDPWSVSIDWGDSQSDSFSSASQGSLGSLTHTYADNG